MPPHWAETHKHKAKEGFERAGRDDTCNGAKKEYQRPPQPMLTPNGPMRRAVDQRVREKQEAIKAKFARDRQLERER